MSQMNCEVFVFSSSILTWFVVVGNGELKVGQVDQVSSSKSTARHEEKEDPCLNSDSKSLKSSC